MASRFLRTGSSSSGRPSFSAMTTRAVLTTGLYTVVLRSVYWPSASMSMPSASHWSIRSACRLSGNRSLIWARASHTTQRWLGVWTPPLESPRPARSRKSLIRDSTASSPFIRASFAAVATLCTTKPVSGGELKLVESRSMFPSAFWMRVRNSAASFIRSWSVPSLWCFDCG